MPVPFAMGCSSSKAPAAAPKDVPKDVPKDAPPKETPEVPTAPKEASGPATAAAARDAEALLRSIFDGLDVDKSGKLDREELRAALTKEPRLPALLDAADLSIHSYALSLDSDRDGLVSWDEFWSSLKDATRIFFDIKVGDRVVIAESGERGLVQSRTTTDVRVSLGSGALRDLGIEEVCKARSIAEERLKQLYDKLPHENGLVPLRAVVEAVEADEEAMHLLHVTGLALDRLHELDTNQDGLLSWAEFKRGVAQPSSLRVGDFVASGAQMGHVSEKTATAALVKMADGREAWFDLKELERPAFDYLQVGETAVVSLTGRTGKVVKRTTTDVLLEMADGSREGFSAEELARYAPKPEQAQIRVIDTTQVWACC